MVPQTKRELPTGKIRFTEEDFRIVARLRKKTGTKAISEILRQGLRALAEKNGIEV
jgi:hypothetical protein